MLFHKRSIHLILVTMLMSVGLMVPSQAIFAANTEIAFVWRFAYQHTTGAGALDVMIVEHEVNTHEILTVLDEFTYGVPCSPNGGSITCDLDIRSAVQDAYIQLGLKEYAASVHPSESYRWMVVETTGAWRSIPVKAHFSVANHSSIRVAATTDSSGKAVRYTSAWNSYRSTSAFYQPQLNQSHTMGNRFDCPLVGQCITTNYLTVGGRTTILDNTTVNATTIAFQLSPSQIVITPPIGFDMESFVIDPPKAGYG